jgi:hypothetical protein
MEHTLIKEKESSLTLLFIRPTSTFSAFVETRYIIINIIISIVIHYHSLHQLINSPC